MQRRAVHIVVPQQPIGERASGSDTCQTLRESAAGLPAQTGEQAVDAIRIVAHQDEVAARLQRRPCAGVQVDLSMAGAGIDRSSLNTAPPNPRVPLRISPIQRRENPAGNVSTSGYTTCAGMTELSETPSHR